MIWMEIKIANSLEARKNLLNQSYFFLCMMSIAMGFAIFIIYFMIYQFKSNQPIPAQLIIGEPILIIVSSVFLYKTITFIIEIRNPPRAIRSFRNNLDNGKKIGMLEHVLFENYQNQNVLRFRVNRGYGHLPLDIFVPTDTLKLLQKHTDDQIALARNEVIFTDSTGKKALYKDEVSTELHFLRRMLKEHNSKIMKSIELWKEIYPQ